jgi:hypothetical protein
MLRVKLCNCSWSSFSFISAILQALAILSSSSSVSPSPFSQKLLANSGSASIL